MILIWQIIYYSQTFYRIYTQIVNQAALIIVS